jgi:hypothetical protein
MKEFAVGFVIFWAVVCIVSGFSGYLFADVSKFRCHDGGFAARVASGLIYGTALPLRELSDTGKSGGDIAGAIHDLPKLKPSEPESHLKGFLLAVAGYSIGSSLSFAQHAQTCSAPPASPCRSEPKSNDPLRRQLTLPCS